MKVDYEFLLKEIDEEIRMTDAQRSQWIERIKWAQEEANRQKTIPQCIMPRFE